jgi:hypothetical protein
VPEGRVGGECGVDEREHDDRDAQATGLGQYPEGVGVTDPEGPFVDVFGNDPWVCTNRTQKRSNGVPWTYWMKIDCHWWIKDVYWQVLGGE